tara:strand:+ start:232 stop:894 length:663 start_codon:yes stop_codon:yes gene_type:complete
MRLRYLSDSYRLTRAFLVGTVSTVVLLPLLSVRETLTVAISLALTWDLLIFLRRTWLLSTAHTREILSCSEARESLVAERTIALVFLSLGMLSFCLTELHSPQDALPNRVHIFTAFLALFLMWLELHNGFALYYAKRYYEMNPAPLAADDTQHGFIFEGNEPSFSDFLYISYSIGLTYSMTDCGLEDASVRRIVLVHCLSSFLFASTIFSIILSLVTQVA